MFGPRWSGVRTSVVWFADLGGLVSGLWLSAVRTLIVWCADLDGLVFGP